jgi:uncharacterized protein YcbK (DUF882 family)
MASLLVLAGASSVHDASANGDTRTLSFHHTHSGEDLTVTFKRNGRYDEEALKQINHYLRDWRSQEQTTMDRHLFDILWEVYRDVDGKQPIQIISSYRSPATNAMLRRRSAHTGVARFSQHMLGHAMDFFIPGVSLEKIRFAGLRLQRGGVGFYPTSGSPFVHLDTGNVRHWPRMTREQLVRVFPDGRTVHIPSDGNPLPGYELALADVQHHRHDDDGGSSAGSPSLLASLFSGSKQADDDDESASTADDDAPAARAAPAAFVASTEAPKSAERIPLPRAKPAAAATYQLASADSQLVVPGNISTERSASNTAKRVSADPVAQTSAPQTPADIINARGFWGEEPATPKQATQAQIAALAARNAFASADPQVTASLPEGDKGALAYAPLAPPIDRSHIVAASAPIPRGFKPSSAASSPMPAEITSVVTKGEQGAPSVITTAGRISPAVGANAVWMRAMIVTPSTSTAGMLATSLGDPDMTPMRHLFVKPDTAIAITFSDDPQLGITCDRFSGSAAARLTTTSFVVQTASLR